MKIMEKTFFYETDAFKMFKPTKINVLNFLNTEGYTKQLA